MQTEMSREPLSSDKSQHPPTQPKRKMVDGGWEILLKECIKQYFGIGVSICTSISIRKVINIYHESPYEMQTELSFPWPTMRHSTRPPNQKVKRGGQFWVSLVSVAGINDATLWH